MSTSIKTSTHTIVQKLPPWSVILHDDDKITFDHVVDKVVSLTPLNQDEAQQRALEAHEEGKSLLLVTGKERAELFEQQFHSCVPSIWVSIEAR